jgi:hypothetical protein
MVLHRADSGDHRLGNGQLLDAEEHGAVTLVALI